MKKKKRPIKVGEGIREMALRNKLKGKNKSKINNDFLKYMPETEEREIALMVESSKVSMGEAVMMVLKENCKPFGFGEIGEKQDEFIASDIRIRLNSDGSGYVHVMDRDSSTINFEKVL